MKEEQSAELKACPFCNDKAYTQVGTDMKRVMIKIGCGNCGVFLTETMLSGTNFDQFDEIRNKLIAKWNRRAKE